ncbi:aquaporin isoform X2 [Nematostella vectensis]|uniref:aquaporin isoform X2 n=1 Tax=Nematostella vectensis TaxID=45351 RepID=UPI0020772B2A|nr:aquaporin isoform X2 [Nematostella vectensis]
MNIKSARFLNITIKRKFTSPITPLCHKTIGVLGYKASFSTRQAVSALNSSSISHCVVLVFYDELILSFEHYVTMANQTLQAICGAAAIYGMASQHSVEASNLAVNARSPDVSIGQAVGMEIWATFILVLIVFAAGDSDRQHMRGYGPPLSIGIVVFINLSLTIPISGGSMNPARSFGPTVVMNFWKDHWMYWIGPIAGSCLASLCYHHVFAQRAINARISSAEEMPSKSHQNEGFNCLEVVCNKSQISENGQETNVCRL